MAMSSLGAQLAALHSKSTKNPGSIINTSKRKSDTVGRGMAHSAQLGHALKKSNFKPSVLYEDAKAAADVPLSTLRENAYAALHELILVDTDFEQYLALVNVQSLNTERGLLTNEENQQIAKSIAGLLNLIGSVLKESSTRSPMSIYSNCLQILEYLLRRYDIHTRNAQDLVVAVLPHHDDALFARVLQLVDLASLPTFTFLRPYAVATPHANVTRSLLAKQAAKDTALFKIICRTAQLLRTKQRRGTASVTSFCCAVIVESLTLQARNTGNIHESTVRVLMPFCLHACAWQSTGDWRAFGYVILSTVTDHTDLAPAILEKILHAILNGGIDTDALTLIMGILPKTETSLVNVEKTVKGIALPLSVFQRLVDMESIHTILGIMHQQVRVASFVATMLDLGLKHNEVEFVVAMISNPALASLWSEASYLIASVAATTINLVAEDCIDHEAAATLITALRGAALSNCDRGIAHAVGALRKSDKVTKDRVAKALGVQVNNKKEETFLLPPSLALDYADASIRKNAMDRLLVDHVQYDEALLTTLMEHFVMEDDNDMALAAAKAIDKILLTSNLQFNKDCIRLLTQALAQNSRREEGQWLELALKFAGIALKCMMDSNEDGIETLTMMIVAHCEQGRDKATKGVSSAASKALCVAFSEKKCDVNTAKKVIATDPRIMTSIEKTVSAPLQPKALTVTLWALVEQAGGKKSARNRDLQSSAWKALNCLLGVLSRGTIAIEDSSVVVKCVQLITEKSDIANVLDLLSAFARTPSDDSFASVSVPVLKRVVPTIGDSTIGTLLEIAHTPTLSVTAVVRLITLATEIAEAEQTDPREYLVSLLALLGHSDYDTRKAALALMSSFKKFSKASTAPVFQALSNEQSTKILMDGTAALPAYFRNLCSGKTSSLRKILLEQCVQNARAKWLPIDKAVGTVHALAVMLNAIELAGEASFPLRDRWSMAGEKILDTILASSGSETINVALIDAIIRMLKGILVHDPSELVGMIISSGPSKRGTRSRSYSVGRASGIEYASPYPKEMLLAVKKCLDVTDDSTDTALEICRTLIRDVLSSASWCKSVYKQLPKEDRISIVRGLMNVLSSRVTDDAFNSIMNLPLETSDINDLLKTIGSDCRALVALTDHVRSNASIVVHSKAIAELTYTLFGILRELSSGVWEDDEGEVGFAQQSTLRALTDLVTIEDSEFPVLNQNQLNAHTKLLVNLIGSSSDNSIRPLTTWKARKSALTLMSRLCALYPSIVVGDMATAMLRCTTATQINDSESLYTTLSSIHEVLSSVVPLLHEHCNKAEVSLINVLNSFADEVEQVTDASSANHILRSMTDALASTSDVNALVTFFCLLLARSTKNGKGVLVVDVIDLVKSLESRMQTKLVLDLCSYINQFLPTAADNRFSDAETAGISWYLFENEPHERNLALRYCKSLCGLLKEVSLLPSVGEYMKISNDSPLCLLLWQALLLLQSTCIQVDGSVDSDCNREIAVEQCKHHIDEALSIIQNALPSPVFLAATSSLIEDEENGSLRTRALRILAERTTKVHSKSPEASIFLDLLPMVVDLLEQSKNDEEAMLLQQSAAVVVEQFARTLCSPSEVLPPSVVKALMDALTSTVSNLKRLSHQKHERDFVSNQLASTLTLCVSTLLRLLKVRCLPVLPQLVDSLLTLLVQTSESHLPETANQNKLLQCSILRAMTSMTISLPQFLIPHLDQVLSPSVLVAYTIEDIDVVGTLAEKVPSRQLLPASARALKKCHTAGEFSVLLRLTQASIEQSSRLDIGAVKGYILQSVLYCCDKDTSMMEVVNKVLVSMVMKLSEAQLRSIFGKLIAWRGEDNISRNFAFWSFSSALSKELKSIFLPILSTIIPDALQGLDVAVSMLCSPRKIKKPKFGSIESLLYLPELLSCLGNCFAADAREGGSWVREESDRYSSFREALSALLLARVPTNFPFASGPINDPYNELIVQDGGLISCLVSLASAAGNDILWKPLNHAVLSACGMEGRVEIQRAGLTCLLKLMKTLGEEYMVLLPECLPVLSELLEAEEGTAAIARDCVELAEDLLGESLEESLR